MDSKNHLLLYTPPRKMQEIIGYQDNIFEKTNKEKTTLYCKEIG